MAVRQSLCPLESRVTAASPVQCPSCSVLDWVAIRGLVIGRVNWTHRLCLRGHKRDVLAPGRHTVGGGAAEDIPGRERGGGRGERRKAQGGTEGGRQGGGLF